MNKTEDEIRADERRQCRQLLLERAADWKSGKLNPGYEVRWPDVRYSECLDCADAIAPELPGEKPPPAPEVGPPIPERTVRDVFDPRDGRKAG